MAIILILLLGTLLRFYNLNQSLWLDESVQVIEVTSQWTSFRTLILGDFHPPLYHYFLHFWTQVFGNSEIALRFPSVLFGIATILIVYWIGKELVNKKLGLLAAFLMAIAPYHIYYSQEARMYSLVTMFSALSILTLLFSLRRGKLWWVLWILTTLGAIYTDYFAFLVWFFEIIAVIILFKKANWKFVFYNILVVGLFLPWLPVFLAQIKNGAQATQLLPSWGLLTNLALEKIIPVTFAKFSLGRISFDNKLFYFGGVLLLFIGYILPVANAFKKDKRTNIFLLGWLLIPLILATLISIKIPSYQPFRLLLVLPAFILLLAHGVINIRNMTIQWLVVFLISCINLISIGIYYFNPVFQRENWRGAATYLEDNYKEDAVIIFPSLTSNWPYLYYQKKQIAIMGTTDGLSIDKKNFAKLMNDKLFNKEHVWLVHYLQPLFDPDDLTKNWLENNNYVRIEEKNFNGVEIWRYENRN